MRLVLEVYNDGRHLANDSTSLKGEGLYRKHTVRNFKFYLLTNALFLSPASFLISLFLSCLSICLSLSPSLSPFLPPSLSLPPSLPPSLSPSLFLFLLSPSLSLSPLSYLQCQILRIIKDCTKSLRCTDTLRHTSTQYY